MVVVESDSLRMVKQCCFKFNKMADTKRLSDGVYVHIKTGKYVVVGRGEKCDTWNIWNDYYCCDEFACGYFKYKWQCVEYLNEISN